MYAVAINSGALTECMRNLHVLFLVFISTYQYVQVTYSCTILYKYVLYVPVHTGMNDFA